jgi:hypothetical protein
MGDISMKFEFAVYLPPEKGMPYLAVKIEGVKTPYKKVTAKAAKSIEDAERLVKEMYEELQSINAPIEIG